MLTVEAPMDSSMSVRLRERLHGLLTTFQNSRWSTRSLVTAIIGIILFGSWRTGRLHKVLRSTRKSKISEPGLFKKHSSFEGFTTATGFVYPKIRVFYHAHPQAGKLPKNLPLLVFMHGLGGNATQFAPLLTSMVNVAPCLAIDLPGCGLSDFKPNDPAAYTTGAFAELLASAIERYRDKENNQQVVLIGHSMGCSIAALLASSTSPLQKQLKVNWVVGMIAICPRSGPPDQQHTKAIERLRWVPATLFDLLRLVDRRGGLNSASITRVVGEGADVETRRLQQRYNQQSKSAVFLRIVTSILPSSPSASVGWPGKVVWSGMKVPLFLVTGEADRLAPPKELERIMEWLSHSNETTEDKLTKPIAQGATEQRSKKLEDVAPDEEAAQGSVNATDETGAVPTTAGDAQLAQYQLSKAISAPHEELLSSTDVVKDEQISTKHDFALKTTILPAPAAHGLMYATSTVRILSGLIEGFLSRHVDERLSLGWQLQHLTTSGKWDVKNLKKWQSVDPCSEPIGAVFRAMKTMREVDEVHNPKELIKHFSSSVLPDGVAMIVDISHESPVYDPKGLEEGGVEYHKFPTVSKLPPTADEVEHFISLIDQLRRSPKVQPRDGEAVHPVIGVHCHYGFNRTGFFIICYLVERCGYRLQDAIEEFTGKRPPGIKHDHFVNELYVRYAVKMERRGTIVG